MSSFIGIAQPYTSTSLVSEETPYATEPMIVSYWTLPGSHLGGLARPRSVRRSRVLMPGSSPAVNHADAGLLAHGGPDDGTPPGPRDRQLREVRGSPAHDTGCRPGS